MTTQRNKIQLTMDFLGNLVLAPFGEVSNIREDFLELKKEFTRHPYKPSKNSSWRELLHHYLVRDMLASVGGILAGLAFGVSAFFLLKTFVPVLSLVSLVSIGYGVACLMTKLIKTGFQHIVLRDLRKIIDEKSTESILSKLIKRTWRGTDSRPENAMKNKILFGIFFGLSVLATVLPAILAHFLSPTSAIESFLTAPLLHGVISDAGTSLATFLPIAAGSMAGLLLLYAIVNWVSQGYRPTKLENGEADVLHSVSTPPGSQFAQTRSSFVPVESTCSNPEKNDEDDICDTNSEALHY
jgi:hypothetical protein